MRTLQKAWRELRTPEDVRSLFDNVAARVLRRLYQRPQLEPVQLFRHYGFSSVYADRTLDRVARLAERVAGDELWVAGLPQALPHPRRFYSGLAERLAEEPLETACCWVHGDLMRGNLLMRDGHLTGILDWGASGVGDPALDLLAAWTCFGARGRAVFLGCLEATEEQVVVAKALAVRKVAWGLEYYRTTLPGFARGMEWTLAQVEMGE